MAYLIAAADAITVGRERNRDAFVGLVCGLCPEVQGDIVSDWYGRICSGHLHTGFFPGGASTNHHCQVRLSGRN